MRKMLLMAALVVSVAIAASAAEPKKKAANDSVKVTEMQELVVKAVVAPKNAPFAVTKVGKKELEGFSRSGQELPFLFSRTPGVLAWSENGLGTGTTYMRIRGAGDSRINVTLDGVALNSPEDQCVFWANMNSYAAFLGNAQIQRGVGTSTNGDGAFGGSVALQTLAPSYDPTATVNLSAGYYGTYNVGGSFSTGLTGIKLKKGFLVLDGAYHHTGTEGYVHGTAGNSGSYYGALTYMNERGNFKLSYKHIGNYEKTGQAWNGVTAGDDYYSLNYSDGVKTYQDMYNMGLGKFNSLYERFVGYYDNDWNYHITKNNDGTYKTERYQMKDGSYWPQTTDNFWQNHNLLNASWKINDHWSTTATLHYTRGHGYYEEFKFGDNDLDVGTKLSKFGLSRTPEPGIKFVKRTSFVRKKGLTQNTYGFVWNVNYQNRKWDVIGGTSVQNFEGNHYGYLTYIADDAVDSYYRKDGKDYKYYDSDASKLDAQVFVKATYHINEMFDVYADVQYRHVGYKTNGINDKFIDNGDGTYSNQRLDINQKYDFVNPKAGFSFHKNGHNAYISYAMSHREPERNNFTDNGAYPAPKAESVHDVELGYSYQGRTWYAGLNLYGMFYRNQLVQTGALSDIGENLTTNIKNSYRMGMELNFGYNPTNWLTVEGNAAISRNQILDFDEEMSVDWEDHFQTVHYDNSTLAFSPTAILNGFLTFHKWGLTATWHTNYVSRQYLDNTCSTDRMLPHYTTTAIRLSYDWKPCSKTMRNNIKDVMFGLNFNNIFNSHYASSGWVYSSALSDSQGNVDPNNRYYQIGYIPMAGFTMMGSIALKF